MNSLIKKVNMVMIPQPDLERAVEFYQKIGMTLKFHVKNAWAEFTIGDVKIGLVPVQEGGTGGYTGIILETSDVNAFFEQFKGVVEFLGEPIERPYGKMVSFKDTAGNILDLFQPTPENMQEILEKVKKEEGCCGEPQSCEDCGCDDACEEKK
jgi:catechol 2,3-dioxygenase-like lactoylglutathione lyase family enzyme